MPRRTNSSGPYFTHMRDAEKSILVWALEQTHGKVKPAADLIAITNGYMRKLMEKHGLLVRRRNEKKPGFELILAPEIAKFAEEPQVEAESLPAAAVVPAAEQTTEEPST